MKQGGWRTASVYRRYAITTGGDLIDAVGRLDAYLDREEQGGAPASVATWFPQWSHKQ